MNQYKIPFTGKLDHCEACSTGKLRKPIIEKASKESYDVLEVIASDTKSFSVSSYDGYHLNVKFVDSCTGFVYTGWISDSKSRTILEEFCLFKERMETLTGKRIKYFRTDGGTEYDGAFSDFLKASGIIRQIGAPYRKHVPPRAERAHQTITQLGKAMLEASGLPKSFFSDAQRTATYIYNRTVHQNLQKSPYELIFKRKPKFSKMFPFGCVGFAYLPLEQRSSLKKLENSGIRCRLLGYGDDSGVQERQGFKLLKEDDFTVFYSVDVVFKSSLSMTPPTQQNLAQNYQPQAIHDDDLWSNSRSSTSSESLPSQDSSSFDDIDEAISRGHIATRSKTNRVRFELDAPASTSAELSSTSSDPSFEPESDQTEDDAFVALARMVDLPISFISDEEFYKCFSAAMSHGCPQTYEEAMASSESEQWKQAMNEEMDSIRKAETWVVKRPEQPLGKAPVNNRWVFTKKFDRNGKVIRYKARLVAKGFTQREGIDFNETWSPVAKFKSIRLLIAICAKLRLEAYQDDVPTAFLRGILKEIIWMTQPRGFETADSKALCLLLKTLYGLKQSPREWNEVLTNFLIKEGFRQCQSDLCIFVHKKHKNPPLIVGVYVDDIITIGKGKELHEFRERLRAHFNITEGGSLNWYLGVAFERLADGSFILDQKIYVQQKLEEFKEFIGKRRHRSPLPENYQELLDTRCDYFIVPSDFPYRKIVGSLMYAMLCSRAVSLVSRFLDKPKSVHIYLVIRILQYLSYTQELALIYPGHNPMN